jgi:ATP-binding cassette subfamily C protein LapB
LGKPDATDEEILTAARLAGVEAFIAGHPLGYDMPVAEAGQSLSGGQKQAIGLARILIRKPQILFLDEPTAHFDVRSELEFIERLKLLADNQMTIIVSTHRLSLLKLVDRLLLFEKGRLMADGPRDKVLALLQGGSTPSQSSMTPELVSTKPPQSATPSPPANARHAPAASNIARTSPERRLEPVAAPVPAASAPASLARGKI